MSLSYFALVVDFLIEKFLFLLMPFVARIDCLSPLIDCVSSLEYLEHHYSF